MDPTKSGDSVKWSSVNVNSDQAKHVSPAENKISGFSSVILSQPASSEKKDASFQVRPQPGMHQVFKSSVGENRGGRAASSKESLNNEAKILGSLTKKEVLRLEESTAQLFRELSPFKVLEHDAKGRFVLIDLASVASKYSEQSASGLRDVIKLENGVLRVRPGHELADKKSIEIGGIEYQILADLPHEEIERVHLLVKAYVNNCQILATAKIKEMAEEKIIVKDMPSKKTGETRSVPVAQWNNKTLEGLFTRQVSRILQEDRKEARRAEESERKKDEEHADILREVVKDGVKKHTILNEGLNYRDKTFGSGDSIFGG
jgi:hypothetical protein